jgi:flagellar biosynthesis protein FlhA
VIISVAAALLLSRGGTKGAADVSFFAQLGRYPAALATVAGLMAAVAVVPGMPFLPFMAGGPGLGTAAWFGGQAGGPKPPRRSRDAGAPAPIGDVLDFR